MTKLSNYALSFSVNALKNARIVDLYFFWSTEYDSYFMLGPYHLINRCFCLFVYIRGCVLSCFLILLPLLQKTNKQIKCLDEKYKLLLHLRVRHAKCLLGLNVATIGLLLKTGVKHGEINNTLTTYMSFFN